MNGEELGSIGFWFFGGAGERLAIGICGAQMCTVCTAEALCAG